MMRSVNEERTRKKTRKVQSCKISHQYPYPSRTASYYPHLEELDGNEGILVAKIGRPPVGITRSVIVKCNLRKVLRAQGY